MNPDIFTKQQLSAVISTTDIGDGETMLSLNYDKADGFISSLLVGGWTCTKEYALGASVGSFLVNGEDTVYVMKNSSAKIASAFVGAKLPTLTDECGEELYDDTVFHQIYNDPDTASGLTYVIRLKDGRFVIIDGGYNIDAAGLLKLMRRIHPLCDPNGTFEVAAWIFTHPHDDHLELFCRVMREAIVRSRLNIRRIVANFSGAQTLTERDLPWLSWSERVREYAKMLEAKGCEFIKPHAAYEFNIGELTANIFFTADEYVLTDAKSVNDASLVFTLKNNNAKGAKRLMILGDTGEISGALLMKMYQNGELKSDIVQIAHHGLNGPDYSLYDAIGAKCCFWMINIRAYKQRANTHERNYRLRESDAFHFYSCFGESHIKL